MPVGYENRPYPSEADVCTVSKRDIKQPPAVRDSFLESCKSTLVSLVWSALTTRSFWTNIFFTVRKVGFPEKMACVRGAYQYTREHGAAGKDEALFWAGAVSTYQHGLGKAFIAKRAADV